MCPKAHKVGYMARGHQMKSERFFRGISRAVWTLRGHFRTQVETPRRPFFTGTPHKQQVTTDSATNSNGKK